MAITFDVLKKKVENNQLSLTNSGIKDNDIPIICSFLNKHSNITTLVLSSNLITDLGAKTLAKNTKIKFLDLINNSIGDKGAEALAKNTTINQLYLSFNKIGDKGAEALAKNTTIKILWFLGNDVSKQSSDAIDEMIARNNESNSYPDDSHSKNSPKTANDNKANKNSNISLMVLGGFIAVAGIAMTAIAFVLLNSATFGTPALATTCFGLGLFAVGVYKNRTETSEHSHKSPTPQ